MIFASSVTLLLSASIDPSKNTKYQFLSCLPNSSKHDGSLGNPISHKTKKFVLKVTSYYLEYREL